MLGVIMMKKYICIRDDDTNYYTEANELKECYGEFWNEIPLTLAVIPFVHGSDRKIIEMQEQNNKYEALRNWEIYATEAELTEYHKLAPIGGNQVLVRELKRCMVEGKIEIAQHGVNHRYTEFGEEMRSSSIGFAQIRYGKEYLEKVFGVPINVFIPPANTIDNVCAEYIKELGMDLFSCGSVIFTSKFAKLWLGIKHLDQSYMMVRGRIMKEKPPIRQRGGFTITGSITFDAEKDENKILESIKDSLDRYGFASLTTHYRLLSEKYEKGRRYNYKARFHGLLKILTEIEGLEFVTASKYINLLKESVL